MNEIMNYLLVKSWIWLFWFAWDTFKYVGMLVFSIFKGPAKTINDLAIKHTIRKIGYLDEDVFKVERVKVIAWMSWATIYLLLTAGLMFLVYASGLTNGVN